VQIQLPPDAVMKIECSTQQSIVSNHSRKRKAVTTENNNYERVAEKEYLGYDGKFFLTL
jgi:hypothetical protein